MDKSMILPGLFYIITEIIQLVKGECNVPTYWYTPTSKQYWQYNDPSGASAMWMARYDNTGYNVALMSSKNQLQAMVLNYLCYDTYRPDANGATTYMVRVSFNQFSCRIMTTTESAILIREKVVPSGTSATSCQQSNNIAPQAFWEVQYPDITAKTCPFPEGDFQVTVEGGYYCTGNSQTAVRVQGENVKVYCVQNNGIANEVGRMVCYDSLAGSTLDTDANGGILLMEDRTTTVNSGRLNYRCVRYGTSGSTVSIKMKMSDTHALCESGVGFSSPNTQGFMSLTMTRSGSIFPNPDQTTPPFQATIRPEPCSFPAGWRVPKLWWYLTGQTGQVVYVQEFSTKEMRQRSVITDPGTGTGTIATIGVHQCADQKVEGSSRMYVRYQLDVSPSRRCVEYVRIPDSSSGSTPDALMTRESQLGESLTAAECTVELITVRDFKLLVPFPFDPQTKSCSFSPGYYSTTYGTNPIQEVCTGQTSTTTVTSNSLVMNTCSTTSTYEMPLNTRLSCVTSFAATDLYDADRDDGDFTIMAYQDPVSERYHYYCARYRQLGNDIVMSLNVQDKYETICDTTARFDTAGFSNGKQYIRFTMKYIQDLTTLPPGVTVRRNTCTDCLNNAECVTNNVGEVTCLCKPGTTGTKCETDLPFGRCQDQPCNSDNTRSCTNTEGGYYYCECLAGYDGPRCETNYNECSSSPCLNGGACQDSVNGYTCQCTAEFAGQSCEFRVASAAGSDSSDLTVLIVLICLLAAVVLAVVVVSVCMCHYRSEQREKSLIVDNDEISQAYGGSSMQAWYPDYKSNNSDSGSIGRHP